MCTIKWHVVKPGTTEHGTVKYGMPEHQIRNGKTWNTKPRTRKIRNIMFGTVKPGTLNPKHQFTEPQQATVINNSIYLSAVHLIEMFAKNC